MRVGSQSFTASCSATFTERATNRHPPASPIARPANGWWSSTVQDLPRIAFEQVAALPSATWPEGPVPQQLHLDFQVPSLEALELHHRRALALGAKVLEDRSASEEEPLWVYADPAGHPFCIFVTTD